MGAVLAVKNLKVILEGKTILEDLSFELNRGDSLAVIGPNGSGKTVLLRALLGIVPYSGTITWDPGVKLGYVPQKVDADRQLPFSVADLLRAKSRVLRLQPTAAQLVQGVIGLSPDILESPIGRLSGGQFQKALIAFALLGDPNVLLFDEPTTSLDQLAEERVYEIMHKLQD